MPAGQPSRELLVPKVMTVEEWNARDWRVDGPVALRVAPADWQQVIADVPRSRRRLPPGTIGLTPVPDPIGGISVFPVCVSGDPDLICYPAYVRRTPTGVEYGPCRCRRARPDLPDIDLSGDRFRLACELQWNGRNRPTCKNNGCRGGCGCTLVRVRLPIAQGPGRPTLETLVCVC